MPRRNNRDRRLIEPKDYSSLNQTQYDQSSENSKSKPVRRRKGKWDKKIYKEDE